MIPQLTGSTHTPIRLFYATLATLALMVIASPGSAAGSQPFQQSTTGAASGTINTGPNQPAAICPPNGQCFADVPSGNPFYEFVNRIYQQDLVSGYPCGGPGEPCDADNRPYYRPADTVTRQQMSKFIDNARRLPGIHIEVITGTIPIYAQTGNATAISGRSTGGANGVGVHGESTDGKGVYGSSTGGIGVQGESTTGIGLLGYSDTGIGIDGHSTTNAGLLGSSISGDGVSGSSESGIGVFGQSDTGLGMFGYSDTGIGIDGHSTTNAGLLGSSISGDGVSGSSESGNGVYGESTTGAAGYFSGNVTVTGTCCDAAAGTFRIDNPADPANKYLYHSAVQSPDMMDIYNGNISTDAKGEAIVIMPTYFEPLNRDFRYQLTTIGQFAQAMVLTEIKDNSFTIKTDKPNVKVSWQVTGIRQDAYANAHRTPVEQDKPANERGTYLHPTEHGQPASSAIDYDKHQNGQQVTWTPSQRPQTAP